MKSAGLRRWMILMAVTGCVAGAVTLSAVITVFYPGSDALNRLYAGVFIPFFILCAILCYALTSPGPGAVFLRAWSWWPPLLLLPGVC